MTEIASTKSPASFIKSQPGPALDKTATTKRNGPTTADLESLQAVATEIQTKRLDLLMAVQTESKKTFILQPGVAERAAAQGVDLGQLEYNGKPLTEMSPEEAAGLVAEDGYFGVAKTSQRLADFVITGGGTDLKRLQAGREGIIKGYNEAEKMWGGKLPEISQQTLTKALELIDARIQELGGGAVIDVQA